MCFYIHTGLKYAYAHTRTSMLKTVTSLFQHEIRVNSGEVVGVKPYQLPFASQEYVEKEVKKLIDVEVVEPSVSLFSSLMVLVKKKDGSLRLRIDFRKLNSITIQ